MTVLWRIGDLMLSTCAVAFVVCVATLPILFVVVGISALFGLWPELWQPHPEVTLPMIGFLLLFTGLMVGGLGLVGIGEQPESRARHTE